MKKDWFCHWFNSPYYPVLYKERNDAEADHFTDRLIRFLNPAKEALMLDMACGRGRYTRSFHKLGYRIHGIDSSPSSIRSCQESGTGKMSFALHDMRIPFNKNTYDFVFSFFTSFGYYHKDEDNLKILRSVCENLKQDGIFVLEFPSEIAPGYAC